MNLRDKMKRNANYNLQEKLHIGSIDEVTHMNGYLNIVTSEGYILELDDDAVKRIAKEHFANC
jgi:hypothetical protein